MINGLIRCVMKLPRYQVIVDNRAKSYSGFMLSRAERIYESEKKFASLFRREVEILLIKDEQNGTRTVLKRCHVSRYGVR